MCERGEGIEKDSRGAGRGYGVVPKVDGREGEAVQRFSAGGLMTRVRGVRGGCVAQRRTFYSGGHRDATVGGLGGTGDGERRWKEGQGGRGCGMVRYSGKVRCGAGVWYLKRTRRRVIGKKREEQHGRGC